jgi:hypothetical protein
MKLNVKQRKSLNRKTLNGDFTVLGEEGKNGHRHKECRIETNI